MISLARYRLLVSIALLAGGISACSGDARPFEEAIEASQSGLASLTVTVPTGDLDDLVLNIGQQYTLRLEGSNINDEVFNLSTSDRRWSVDNPAVASVDNNGTLTGLSNGSTTVRVTVADIDSNEFPLVVSDAPLTAIQRLLGEPSIDPCIASSYRATGTFADGSERSLPSVSFSATPADGVTLSAIDDAQASLIATTSGFVSLTASVDLISLTSNIAVNDSLTDIAVSPSPASVTVGSTVQMLASGTYNDGESITTRDLTETLDWSITSDDDNATISTESGSRGLVSGTEAGSATVISSCGDVSTQTSLTITSTGSDTASLSFNVSDPLQLPLRGGQFALRVSTGTTFSENEDVTDNTDFSVIGDTSVLSIGNIGDSAGVIVPITFGTTVIRAVYDGRLVAELEVTVIVQ